MLIQRASKEELWGRTALTFFILCDWNVQSAACDGPFPKGNQADKAREIVSKDWNKVVSLVVKYAKIPESQVLEEPLEKIQRR